MALYHIEFLDYGKNVRWTHCVVHDDDEAAIAAAHRLNVMPHLTLGFEIWEDGRLVYRHTND
jgi:hypothetical protein